MMPLGIKTSPTRGVTSWNQRNKDVEFICGENNLREQSRAIIALLLFPVFSSVRNNKILDWSKLKAFAEDKLNVALKVDI